MDEAARILTETVPLVLVTLGADGVLLGRPRTRPATGPGDAGDRRRHPGCRRRVRRGVHPRVGHRPGARRVCRARGDQGRRARPGVRRRATAGLTRTLDRQRSRSTGSAVTTSVWTSPAARGASRISTRSRPAVPGSHQRRCVGVDEDSPTGSACTSAPTAATARTSGRTAPVPGHVHRDVRRADRLCDGVVVGTVGHRRVLRLRVGARRVGALVVSDACVRRVGRCRPRGEEARHRCLCRARRGQHRHRGGRGRSGRPGRLGRVGRRGRSMPSSRSCAVSVATDTLACVAFSNATTPRPVRDRPAHVRGEPGVPAGVRHDRSDLVVLFDEQPEAVPDRATGTRDRRRGDDAHGLLHHPTVGGGDRPGLGGAVPGRPPTRTPTTGAAPSGTGPSRWRTARRSARRRRGRSAGSGFPCVVVAAYAGDDERRGRRPPRTRCRRVRAGAGRRRTRPR